MILGTRHLARKAATETGAFPGLLGGFPHRNGTPSASCTPVYPQCAEMLSHLQFMSDVT